jgi:hypothetical protein
VVTLLRDSFTAKAQQGGQLLQQGGQLLSENEAEPALKSLVILPETRSSSNCQKIGASNIKKIKLNS